MLIPLNWIPMVRNILPEIIMYGRSPRLGAAFTTGL